jgi:hypothetical protein
MTKENEQQSKYMQFLYLLVKEYSIDKQIDTELRIVYWKEQWGTDYESQFVVYGKRPNTKKLGKYIPYRLRFNTKEQVAQFIRTVISTDHYMSLELHQFSGINNDVDDEYNIDWFNTNENSTTELVAFTFDSPTGLITNYESDAQYHYNTLNELLCVLSNCETV